MLLDDSLATVYQYSHKRWRRVQNIANQLWLLWQKEYWAHTPNASEMDHLKEISKEEDVVLVCDKESPRNQWPLADVTKMISSSDKTC